MLRGMVTLARMVRAEVHCFCAHGFDSRDTDLRSKYTFNRIMKREIMKRWQLNKSCTRARTRTKAAMRTLRH